MPSFSQVPAAANRKNIAQIPFAMVHPTLQLFFSSLSWSWNHIGSFSESATFLTRRDFVPADQSLHYSLSYILMMLSTVYFIEMNFFLIPRIGKNIKHWSFCVWLISLSTISFSTIYIIAIDRVQLF